VIISILKKLPDILVEMFIILKMVISINYPWLRIKTGDGIIEIIEHRFDPLPEVGEYL